MNYKTTYIRFFDIGEQERPLCEVCKRELVDIHHIEPKKMGGKKFFDFFGVEKGINEIENLIGVCRECHNKAHENKISKERLFEIHIENMLNVRK